MCMSVYAEEWRRERKGGGREGTRKDRQTERKKERKICCPHGKRSPAAGVRYIYQKSCASGARLQETHGYF